MKKIHSLAAVYASVLALFTTTTNAATINFTDQASFIAATSSLTVDHFDTSPWVPVNTPLSQPVVSLGNSWTGNNELMAINVAFSGQQSITSADDTPDLIDAITATLDGTDTAVGGFVFLDFIDGVTLSAFDAGNTLLGSVTTTLTSGWQFVGLTSDTAIAKIEFISTSQPSSDDFSLDDFHFGASVVPIPPAVWLFGSGVLGLVGIARRKKAT